MAEQDVNGRPVILLYLRPCGLGNAAVGPAPSRRAVTVPSFIYCGASPVIAPILAAARLAGLSFVVHRALSMFAPLNLLLWRGYRRYGRVAGLALGALGTLSIWIHLFEHNFDEISCLSLGRNTVLLVAGRTDGPQSRNRTPSRELTPEEIERYWKAVLSGTHPRLRRAVAFIVFSPGSRGASCATPRLAGPGAWIGKLVGKGPSERNPNHPELEAAAHTFSEEWYSKDPRPPTSTYRHRLLRDACHPGENLATLVTRLRPRGCGPGAERAKVSPG